MRIRCLAVALAFASLGTPAGARADEIKLRAASAFHVDTIFGRLFADFVKHVNETGKGVVQFDFVRGPEAMPPFELGNALKTGVVDIANIPPNYYERLMPLATATAYQTIGPEEQRRNGAYAFIAERVRAQMNAHYLANYGHGIPFHLYLRRKFDVPDLKGRKIRVPPGLDEFVREFGGTIVQMPPGDIFPALERGVIDGYAWPLWGILDLGWGPVTKYRVDPGWTSVSIHILVNLDRWNAMSPQQREFLDQAGIGFERHAARLIVERGAEERRKQAAAGIETITLTGSAEEKYVGVIYESGWRSIIRRSPEDGPRLRDLLTKK